VGAPRRHVLSSRVRHVDKSEAMALLEREARELPASHGGCAMCGMVAGHPPDLETVAARPSAVVVLDRLATRPGHLLVILRRHAEAMRDVPWREYAEVQRLAWEAARTVERVLAPKRVFIAALGSATQLPMSFPHHHVHVLPLYDGGAIDKPSEVLTWRRGVWLYGPNEAHELAERLREAWEPGED
jgi:diadenosine tetraphosphate (Ap4A) HIT family hydrolase